MSFSKLFYLVPFMVLSFVFSNCPDDTDVCLSLNNGSLEYDSTADIAGFQFNHNGCVTGASGGDATAAGFTISASGTVVLAFSFTGAVIPAGAGTLVDLDGDVNEGCLSEFIFSGPGGDALLVAFSVEPVLGCTDMEACNYDSSANTDDGSCEYPEENFDCEGNCVVAEDCAGVCGGDAVEDCTGLCGGDAQLDECGECGGDGSTCEYGCEEGVEVCLTLDASDLNYSSTADIAGFQFAHNGCVTGASGGDATAAGFTISASGSAVLAFSFSGAVVPAGSGTLVVLDGDVSVACLSDFIFSDSEGEALEVGFPVVLVDGCMDMEACNYNPEANNDDGSCEYPEENFDCDGNCVAQEDCAGVCGGDAVEDECGICEGDGSLCTVSLDLSVNNEAGVMFVNMSNAMDVAGFQFVLSNVEILSVAGGSAEENGFLVSAANGTVVGFSLTGATIPPGEAVLLEVSFVPLWDESCMSDVVLSDPFGGGIAWNVGECVTLDFTVLEGCTDIDACNYNPEANNDDGSCEYPEENFDCEGNCTVNIDCFGECGGLAELDECGECGGDNSTCSGCMDPNALNYDSEALVDCGDCCQYPADAMIGVSNVTEGMIDVSMENITAVAGFQFNITSSCDSVSVLSGTGGSSADAGFMISTSGTTVLGFSLTGATIPAGSGLLVSLETGWLGCDSGSFGLENVILSDIDGSALTFNIMEDFEFDAACSDVDACNYGEPGDCEYPEDCFDCDGNSTCYYSVDINHTGESHLIILMDSISTLEVGDEIGVFDLMGVIETDSTGLNPQYGEVLVGSTVWDGVANNEGAVTEVTAIMSLDLSDFGGPILNGAVDGNPIVVKVYDVSEGIEYEMTQLTTDMGGDFGDIMTVVTDIDLGEAPEVAHVQVIHNSPSPVVDIYLDGALAVENFEYRTATPVLELSTSFTVGIAPADGDVIAEFPFELMAGGEYVVIATGILGDATTPFDLAASGTSFGASNNYYTGLHVYHGSTDAPAVDVLANGGLLFGDLSYGEFSTQVEVAAVDYTIGIAPTGGDVIAEFIAPLSGLGGTSAVVFASGFLSGSDPAFGLFAALTSGDVIALEVPVNIGDPCDINDDGVVDEGFIFDCSLSCVSDAFLGDAWCDEAFPNFNCVEFNCDEGACGDCQELSNDILSPVSFELSQNYPNPFNPETTISFSIPNISEISLTIYDINGRVVDVITEGIYSPGVYSFIWNGMNLSGELVPSGVYLYKLVTPSQTFTKHLTLIR